MNTIPQDQAYRDLALDPTQSFIVQAPAGSGKTTLLIQRYLSLLGSAVSEPEECLAITFTRKAASEMLSRVLEALEAAHKPCSSPAHLKTRDLALKVLAADQKYGWQILENPSRLKIQTIDALCSSIATRGALINKFGYNLEIADDSMELYNEAVRDFITSDNPATDDYLNTLAYHLDNNQTRMLKLFVSMLATREKWIKNLLALSQEQDYMQYFNFGLKTSIQDVLFNAYHNKPHNFTELLELLSLDVHTFTVELKDLAAWQNLSNLILNKAGMLRKTVTAQQGFAAANTGKNAAEKKLLQQKKAQMIELLGVLEGYPDFIAALQIIQQILASEYTLEQQRILQALLKILPILVAHLQLVFQKRGKVDFTEITLNALQALGDNLAPSDLALILDHQIHHIMVDEFQDTAKSQFELIAALTRGWSALEGKTLFLVGDPMQSIYRFRNADVGLFIYAKKYGIGEIKLKFLQLSVNFRSTELIIAWINEVFAKSFPQKDELTNGAISFARSISHIMAKNDSKIYIMHNNSSALEEADKIVGYIKERYAINSAESIAILGRSRLHLKDIINLLNKEEIPFLGVDLDLLANKPIVQDLLNLTNALINLGDNLAWFSLLRSKWIRLKLQDLQALVPTEKRLVWSNICTFASNLNLSVEAKHKLEKLVHIMQHYIAKLGIMNLSQVVFNVWQELGGLNTLQSNLELQNSEQFFKFLEQEETSPDVYKVNYLKNKLKKIYAKADVSALHPVQIMTIHKAKGLEFDTVILPGLAQQIRPDDEELLVWNENLSYKGDTYLLTAPVKSFLEIHDPIYSYIQVLEQKKARYEDLRLLYVACTRAKFNLYLSAIEFKDRPLRNSLLGLIWEHIPAKKF